MRCPHSPPPKKIPKVTNPFYLMFSPWSLVSWRSSIGFTRYVVDKVVGEMYCFHPQGDNLDCVDADRVVKKGVECFDYMEKFAI